MRNFKRFKQELREDPDLDNNTKLRNLMQEVEFESATTSVHSISFLVMQIES